MLEESPEVADTEHSCANRSDTEEVETLVLLVTEHLDSEELKDRFQTIANKLETHGIDLVQVRFL